MKNIKFILLFCLLIVKTSTYAQWNSQNVGVAPSLWGIYFTDYNTGFAVGTNGTIIKTINGGQNWTALNSGITQMLKDVFFVNNSVGYAVGIDKVIKTIDGGNTWVDKTDISWNFNTVYFLDANTGFIGSGYSIEKTTDGGDTWTNLNVGNSGDSWSAIQFINANIGYACGHDINGNGILYKTTNGGANWNAQNVGVVPALNSLSFINALEGCAVGTPGVFLKTSDGGQNWSYTSFSNTSYNDFLKVKMINQNTLYIASGWYLIKSYNGGNSWVIKNPCSPSSKVNLFFNDVNTGYIVGSDTNSPANGILLKTFDGGEASYPLINTSPGSFIFGSVNTGQVSASQALNISNLCEQPLEITSITVPVGFEIWNPFNGTWGSSLNNLTIYNIPQNFNIHFKPTLVQLYQGNVVITSNDNIHPVLNIPISGNGTPGNPGAEIDVNQTALGFGNVLCGQTSAEQSVIISNTGSAALDVSSISAPNGFAVKKGTSGTWASNITSFSIAAGSTETIYVHFTPTQSQTYTGNMLINSNDADEPVTNVSLSGTGYTSPATGLFIEYATLLGYYEGNAAWGDYDNDNDLDLLVMGKTSSSETVTKLYNNNNGTFTEVTGTPFSQAQGPASWFDADNDGDLDLLLTGCGWNGTGMTRLYTNNNGTFTLSPCSFTQLGLGYTESGDYNNDGMTDFLINGESSNQSYTLLYKSNDLLANCHGETGTFQGVRFGTARLTDYDNDGDNDIILSGQTFITTTNCDNYAKIYKNQNGSFTETTNSFLPLDKGSMLIADFNNNGFFDVLLTGKTNNQYTNSTNLYINDGSTFTEVSTGLPMYSTDNYHTPQSAASADMDNDGDMDILLTGYTGVNSSDQISKTQFFLNSFPSFIPSGDSLPSLYRSHATLGDFNNDHRIDLVFAGQSITPACKLFVNTQGALNTPPLAPTTLQVTTAGDSATLTWNAPTDDHTPANGLTYNVYIGTTSHGVDVVSPLSDVATGYRRVVAYGNAGKNNFLKIKGLPQGQFYCGVQAIDGAFAGSPFSSEIPFSTNGTGVNNSTSAIHAFSVYPNPSGKLLNILMPALSIIQVYTVQGAFIADIKNTSVSPLNTTIELSGGVYIFKCTQKEKVVFKKVIILY